MVSRPPLLKIDHLKCSLAYFPPKCYEKYVHQAFADRSGIYVGMLGSQLGQQEDVYKPLDLKTVGFIKALRAGRAASEFHTRQEKNTVFLASLPQSHSPFSA